MKSCWWQIRLRVKVSDIEIDFEELPAEVKRGHEESLSWGRRRGVLEIKETI